MLSFGGNELFASSRLRPRKRLPRARSSTHLKVQPRLGDDAGDDDARKHQAQESNSHVALEKTLQQTNRIIQIEEQTLKHYI